MLAIPNISRQWSITKSIPLLLTALVFAIPISSTGKSILLPATVAMILISPGTWGALGELIKRSWCQAAFLFFAIALVACLWSPAPLNEQWMVLEKYTKLLYLPVLVIGFQQLKTRQLALYAFLASMAVISSLSIFTHAGVMQLFFSSADAINADAVFRNHIMTGLMMSFAAYVAGLYFFYNQGVRRIIYGLLFLAFSYQLLFINIGRTGYVLYFLLMSLLMVQLFNKKNALIALCIFFSVSGLCYNLSPSMQGSVQRVVNEWNHYKEEKNTSVGLRLQFHNYAQKLFKNNVLYGNGTGSFTYYFRVSNPVPAWNGRLLEPHSQYWLIAAEFGILGLLALCFLMGSLIIASLKLPTLKPIALALILIYIVGNISDSLVFYSGTGYFFIVLIALCLGEQHDGNAQSLTQRQPI